MANFVDDLTSLPFPKTNLNPLGGGDPNKYIVDTDWNTVCQAEIDLRGAILALRGDVDVLTTEVASFSMDGTAVATIGTANTAGTAPRPAHRDHVHDHGAQSTGTHHAAASLTLAGFVSTTDQQIAGKKSFITNLSGDLAIEMQNTAADGYSGIRFINEVGDERIQLAHENDNGLAYLRTFGADFNFQTYGATNTLFLKSSNGFIGIGTNNPTAGLQIGHGFGSNNTQIFINGGDVAGLRPHIRILAYTGGSDKPRIDFENDITGVVGSIIGLGNIGTNSLTIRTPVGGIGLGIDVGVTTRAKFYESGDFEVDLTDHVLFVNVTTNRVGVNTNAPTEALHVTGNVRFSGALMPNNSAGTAGQVLTSGGAGAPPTWATSGGGGPIPLATTSADGLMPATVFQQLSETESDGFLTGGAQTISGSNVNVAAFTLVSNGDKFHTVGTTAVPMSNGTNQYIYWDWATSTLLVGTAHQAINTVGNIPVCFVPDVSGGVITQPLIDIRRFVNKNSNKVVLTIGTLPTSTDLGQADFYSLQGAVNWAIGARTSGMMKNIEFKIINSITLTDTVDFGGLFNVKFSGVNIRSTYNSYGAGISDASIIWAFDNGHLFDLSGSGNLTFENLHFDGDNNTHSLLSIFYAAGVTHGISIIGCSVEPHYEDPPYDRIRASNFIDASSIATSCVQWVISGNQIRSGENGIVLLAAVDCVIENNLINNGVGRRTGNASYGDYAIFLKSGSTRCIVSGNRTDYDPPAVHNTGGFRFGIGILESTYMVITNNILHYNGNQASDQVSVAGMTIDSLTDATIANNIIKIEASILTTGLTGHGIRIVGNGYASENISITGNSIWNGCSGLTDMNYTGAISIDTNGANIVIANNELLNFNETGVAVFLNGSYILCCNNHIKDSSTGSGGGNGGIYCTAWFSRITNNRITNISGTHNGIGIVIESTSFQDVSDNFIETYNTGILVSAQADYARVDGNHITNIFAGGGISALGVSPTIVNNVLVGFNDTATYGISLSGSDPRGASAIVSNNNIYGHLTAVVGITLGGMTDLVVTGNRVQNCLTGINGAGATGILIGNNATGCTTHTANIGSMTTTGNI